MNFIFKALIVLCVCLVGCGKSSQQHHAAVTPVHPNGTPIPVGGDIIDNITIPKNFPLSLYVRINSTESGASHTGDSVEINRLLLATKPAPPGDASGYISAEELPIESVSFLAREKMEGYFLGNTYLETYAEEVNATKTEYKQWLIIERGEKQSAERWVCITRIPEWGDMLVYVTSPQVTLRQVKNLLDQIVLKKQTVMPVQVSE